MGALILWTVFFLVISCGVMAGLGIRYGRNEKYSLGASVGRARAWSFVGSWSLVFFGAGHGGVHFRCLPFSPFSLNLVLPIFSSLACPILPLALSSQSSAFFDLLLIQPRVGPAQMPNTSVKNALFGRWTPQKHGAFYPSR